MRAKPKSQLQKEIYDRYQKGRSIAKKMDLISPSALCKKYSVSTSTLQRCLSGGNPTVMTKEETKKAEREYKRYKKLKDEMASHTISVIANEFGVSTKTVQEWGRRRFGKSDNPNPELINVAKTIKSGFKSSFLTMKLSKNPKPGFYY